MCDRSYHNRKQFAQALYYVASLNIPFVSKASKSVDESEWYECLKDYLSQNHKGMKV